MEESKKDNKIEATEKKIIRRFEGEVVSDRMDKTVVVSIERTKIHPIYKKRFKVSKNFKAHDPENQYKTGDFVEIVECRPLSKDKRWKVTKKLK